MSDQKEKVVYSPFDAERLQKNGETLSVIQIVNGENSIALQFCGKSLAVIHSLVQVFKSEPRVFEVFKMAVKIHKKTKNTKSALSETLDNLLNTISEIEAEEAVKRN